MIFLTHPDWCKISLFVEKGCNFLEDSFQKKKKLFRRCKTSGLWFLRHHGNFGSQTLIKLQETVVISCLKWWLLWIMRNKNIIYCCLSRWDIVYQYYFRASLHNFGPGVRNCSPEDHLTEERHFASSFKELVLTQSMVNNNNISTRSHFWASQSGVDRRVLDRSMEKNQFQSRQID